MYKSIEQFHTDRLATRRERDHYARSLGERWEIVSDAETRGILLRDAVSDALGAWKPYQRMQDLLHGRVSGDMLTSLGLAAAGLHRSWVKRLLYSGLSIVLGKVIGRNGVEEGTSLTSTLVKGIGAIVKLMRERRARRAEEETNEEDPVSAGGVL